MIGTHQSVTVEISMSHYLTSYVLVTRNLCAKERDESDLKRGSGELQFALAEFAVAMLSDQMQNSSFLFFDYLNRQSRF